MAGREFFCEFFEVLREQVAIWQTKNDKYKDRREKQKAWEKLAEKWKEVDKNATVETVKKKYHGIRSCYRRELGKVQKSEKSGAGSEDIYVPALWYYENLSFLRDQETQLEGICTIDDSFEEEIEKEPRAKKKSFDPTIFLETAVDHIKKSGPKADKDEADVFGEGWALMYRKLRPSQKIFAKRMIDETFMHAQLDHLSLASSISLGVQQVEVRNNHPNMMRQSYSNSNTYAFVPSPYSPFSTLSPIPTHSPSPSPIYTTMPSNRASTSNESFRIISNEIIPPQNSFQELFTSTEYQ